MVWLQLVILSYLRYFNSFYLYNQVGPDQLLLCSQYALSDLFSCVTFALFLAHKQVFFYFPVFSFFSLTPFLQTYGSGNLKHVGVILQRGIFILLLACFPCWAVLINTQPILLAVKQSTEVARWIISTSNTIAQILLYGVVWHQIHIQYKRYIYTYYSWIKLFSMIFCTYLRFSLFSVCHKASPSCMWRYLCRLCLWVQLPPRFYKMFFVSPSIYAVLNGCCLALLI